jgi:hypothetical protein
MLLDFHCSFLPADGGRTGLQLGHNLKVLEMVVPISQPSPATSVSEYEYDHVPVPVKNPNFDMSFEDGEGPQLSQAKANVKKGAKKPRGLPKAPPSAQKQVVEVTFHPHNNLHAV